MRRNKASGKTRRRKDESSDVTAIALVASAIGNLWQASKRADLQQDRDLLITALRDWQADHARLSARAASLRRAYEALEDINRTFHKQTTELEHEKLHWRAKFFEVAKKLEKLTKEASQPGQGVQHRS
jgi:hypothetical protein